MGAGEVYRDNRKAAGIGLAGLGIIVLAVIAYAAYKVVKPAADAGGHIAESASNIAEGVENLTKGLPTLGEGAGVAIGLPGAFLTPTKQPIGDSLNQTGPQLILEKVGSVRTGDWWDPLRTIREQDFVVRRADTRALVPANVIAVPNSPQTRYLQNQVAQYFSGSGLATIRLVAVDIPVITEEAAFSAYASAPGFRDSPVVNVV